MAAFHHCFPSLVRWYELYPCPFFKSMLSFLGSSDSIFWRISPYLCNLYLSVSHGDSSVLSRDLLDSHLISFLFNSHFLSDVCHLCMDFLIAVFSSLSELKQICDNEENQIWWFHWCLSWLQNKQLNQSSSSSLSNLLSPYFLILWFCP